MQAPGYLPALDSALASGDLSAVAPALARALPLLGKAQRVEALAKLSSLQQVRRPAQFEPFF